MLLSAIVLSLLLPAACRAAPLRTDRRASEQAVPARLLAEALGLGYEFDPVSAIMEFEREGKKAFLNPGTGALFLGRRVVYPDGRVREGGGDLLLPPAAVDLLIGYFHGKPGGWSYDGGVLTVQAVSPPVPRHVGKERPAERTPPPAARERPRKYDVDAVVIDPGHGGKDPGGVGHGGVLEKDIVLEVALELQRELRRRLGGREIILTRSADEFLTLEERSGTANRIDPEKNAVFVSVHANVSLDVKAAGFESYYLTLDSYDETAREVASMENSVLAYEMENYNSYLKEIINRIVDMEYRRESHFLAKRIQNGLSAAVGREGDRGVKSGFFYVLKAVKMPSVLVEIGFVTNKEEVKRLLSEDYRKRIARGIAEGIVDFVNAFRETEGFTKPGS